MPRRPQPQKRVSKKGRIDGITQIPDGTEAIGKWYYENVAEEALHPALELPLEEIIWTVHFPKFEQALYSTTTAWYRLTGALPLVRRCFQVWQATTDWESVHREALLAAICGGYHSAEEVGAILAKIPDNAGERRKFYQ